MGERKEEISKDYKILKKIKCKGGSPALLTMRTDKTGKKSEQEDRQGGEGKMPKFYSKQGFIEKKNLLYNEIMDRKEEHEKAKKKELAPGEVETVEELEEE